MAFVAFVAGLWLLLGLTEGRTNPSVMVLPLQNLGGDPEGEYFAAGLSEDLLTQLFRIEGLKVKSLAGLEAASVEPATDSDHLDWARTTGVTTAVEGSVRHEGDNLRVAVRLIDVSSRDILWAETYDRGVKDSLAIQQDIARRIAAALVATRYQLGQWDEAGRWQPGQWPHDAASGEPEKP